MCACDNSCQELFKRGEKKANEEQNETHWV